MHRGPWALVPPLPFAAAIDASLWRRTTGIIRPRVLTPECYRLRGMWRWQEARDRQIVLNGASFARTCYRLRRPPISERRHDIARKAPQLFLAAVYRQQDIFDAGLAVDMEPLADIVGGVVERIRLGRAGRAGIGQHMRAGFATRQARHIHRAFGVLGRALERDR